MYFLLFVLRKRKNQIWGDKMGILVLSWTSCVRQRASGQGLIACVKLRGTVDNNGYLEDGSKTVQETQLDVSVWSMFMVHGPIH